MTCFDLEGKSDSFAKYAVHYDISRQTGTTATKIPTRDQVPVDDTWDLTRLYKTDKAWEQEFSRWTGQTETIAEYRGQLGNVDRLVELLTYSDKLNRCAERLGQYVYLKVTEDGSNALYQQMKERFRFACSQFEEKSSFIHPELMSLSRTVWKKMLDDERLAPWRLSLTRLLRQKSHTLSVREERLLALSSQMEQIPEQTFDYLNDVDLSFGELRDENGQTLPLTHSTFILFLHSPDRKVRREAFGKFYHVYEQHRHTLASLLAGSIKKDFFYSKARNFTDTMEASLFSEHIPGTVYDHLIEGIHTAMPEVHRYYDIRRKAMGYRDIHFYDTYVPIIPDVKKSFKWDEALELVLDAVSPLGNEYVRVLRKGLCKDRWVDRYENQNKASGAFSYGTYDVPPYIMLNYKADHIDSVFTLAHEAGHAMHSWFSSKAQPWRYSRYEIFLAEIASTLNEELLSQYLLKHTTDKIERAWLVNRQIDAIRATIFRQTMFSEFEKQTHELASQGKPLTVDDFRNIYRELLDAYFGPRFAIDESLTLECFRIPHFYRSFYVYKYATGMSAALALAGRILDGGKKERDDYFKLLKGGCSADPLDILKAAGVDMTGPETIPAAMSRFKSLVDELESGLL
ncbi:MAG: oligoendopeptidase F [Thermoguttaceae bacterium]|nr:oligoendopeptidase F [Thermoguttaceae bacterium]